MIARMESLVRELQKENHGVEALMLYQDGEIRFSHRFVPEGLPRPIYSQTKSFISTAVGMVYDLGKLRLEDTVGDLFPEYRSRMTDPRVLTITLRDLLTMRSGFGGAFLMGNSRRQGEGGADFLAYMLSKPLQDEPGTRFVYSNGDSYLAGCMAERALGKPLLSHLSTHLFQPLEMGYPLWETDPFGTPFGGSGLHLPIGEMIKLGILYLHDGVWKGQRILSHQWVSMAGSKQADTGHPDSWNSDYCFQFWGIGQQEGAFRADGAYGQFTLILPQSNAVVATQCSEQNDVAKFASVMRRCLFD